MNNPINRTTVQVENNKYRVYPKGGPLFYKKSDGTLIIFPINGSEMNNIASKIVNPDTALSNQSHYPKLLLIS